jgi:hypothetical protein
MCPFHSELDLAALQAGKDRRIYEFIVDETLIQVGTELVVWYDGLQLN